MKRIQLTNSNEIVLIDDCDYEEVMKYNWRLSGNNYIKHVFYIKENGKLKQKTIYLHRLIYELHHGLIPEGMVVDHINRNPLLNTLDNLRLATQEQNAWNNSLPASNTSGYKGVSKSIQKTKNKNGTTWSKTYWNSEITIRGKKYTKKFPFTNEGKVLAAKWYDAKRKELCGEFHGQLNFDDDD